MEQIELVVEIADLRLDAFLASRLEQLSRSRIESLIKSENILVNGHPVSKSYRVHAGDCISVLIPPLEDGAPEPCEMKLDIVYEDEHLLVLNKPKGVVVHPAPGHTGDTLVNGLLAHCKDSLSGINGEKRPGIVHRIDKDTSGLLVIAKNDRAHQGLSEQFEKHSIDRVYETVVFGKMPAESGVIDAPIGRSQKDRKKMAVGVRNTKRAVTHYQVLRQYRGFAHLACRLETGRTHQIRVHLSSIGHFVLGDLVYGHSVPGINLDFEGQCLHARVLGFDHPVTGKHLIFESPLPEYFENILLKLERMK
ncbi:MAG: RluA family pseudouridine synthase [Clostridia bacterium]|nr:RluA family pseudouridine synthase [Clostridia bacterium]